MHVLPGARQTIPPEASIKPNEDREGEQRRGGVHENKCHHSMRTFTKLLAEIKLHHGKEANEKRDNNTGRE